MRNYVCYHLHSELSLLDSCTNFKLYVDKAKELNQTAICWTEHGNTYNWVEKKLYCEEQGVKYLHGCEVYLTKALLVENENGMTRSSPTCSSILLKSMERLSIRAGVPVLNLRISMPSFSNDSVK